MKTQKSNSKEIMPKVSFIIPTRNEEKRLPMCLGSITEQDYPKDKIEIIIADAYSTDNTVAVAKKYGARVFKNKLITSESGKAIGVKKATGEIICFVDGDNILDGTDWIKKMIIPLITNTNIVGTEALYFTRRSQDGFIDRYCALIGMNDPLCMWLGAYDRMNVLTGTWTGLPVKQKKRKGYLELLIEPGNIPTIGANGAMFRKSFLKNYPILLKDYLFDVDILEHAVQLNGPVKFAKVNVGIIHLYAGSNIKKFAKKQRRRVRDYLYRNSLKSMIKPNTNSTRDYSYGQKNNFELMKKTSKFAIETILVVPLIYQSFKGFRKVKDTAWFAHPMLCWITLLVYAIGTLESVFIHKELSRNNW